MEVILCQNVFGFNYRNACEHNRQLFLWPLNAIYMHDYLGKSLAMAGFVLMLNSAAGVLGNLLGGYLFDRIGGYKAIMLGILLTIASLIGLTIWHGWPHYVWF